jgi:leucyl aminopeptidase (aminopeptidase T)
MSLENRNGVVSSGVYRNKGESGNLPTGEAYIAPVEGSAEGEIIIDGSFVGIGILSSPLKLIFEKGYMVKAEGPDAEKLNALLGDNPLARNLAELGIGTNDKARVTGVILEDEKIYGSVHLALGSNDTFGGKVAAGIHADGIITKPELSLDGKLIVAGGKVLV